MEVFMKASKQLSIVLAATVLAFGVATLAPQQADASYGYKYTDSQRPPVSTPTGYVNPAMGSTVTVTDPAPTTNKLTTPKASTTIENITVTNVAPKKGPLWTVHPKIISNGGAVHWGPFVVCLGISDLSHFDVGIRIFY